MDHSTHDRNGNMTTVPQPAAPTSGYTCIYDPWNRLTEVNDGTATVGQYTYDGQGWRIRKHVPGSHDSYQHFYFKEIWSRVVDEDFSGGGFLFSNSVDELDSLKDVGDDLRAVE